MRWVNPCGNVRRDRAPDTSSVTCFAAQLLAAASVDSGAARPCQPAAGGHHRRRPLNACRHGTEAQLENQTPSNKNVAAVEHLFEAQLEKQNPGNKTIAACAGGDGRARRMLCAKPPSNRKNRTPASKTSRHVQAVIAELDDLDQERAPEDLMLSETQNPKTTEHQRRVHCLLYTSPSPRD